jgi:hypothetical protein
VINMEHTSVQEAAEHLARAVALGAEVYLVIVKPSSGSPPLPSGAPPRPLPSPNPPIRTPGLPAREAAEDVTTYLQRVRRGCGQVAFRARAWAPAVGLTVAEIERAITHKAIRAEVKLDGRDHGARLVSVGAMLGYVAQVNAVERQMLAAPIWWAAVRAGRHAA